MEEGALDEAFETGRETADETGLSLGSTAVGAGERKGDCFEFLQQRGSIAALLDGVSLEIRLSVWTGNGSDTTVGYGTSAFLIGQGRL